MALVKRLLKKVIGTTEGGMGIQEHGMEFTGVRTTISTIRSILKEGTDKVKTKEYTPPPSTNSTTSRRITTPKKKRVSNSTSSFSSAVKTAAHEGVNTTTRLRATDDTAGKTNKTVVKILGEEELSTAIHTAEDGIKFWGSFDNESARDKAAGKTLMIDDEECISCGNCVERTDQVFRLDNDDEFASVIQQVGNMEYIEEAIDTCPTTCISWE